MSENDNKLPKELKQKALNMAKGKKESQNIDSDEEDDSGKDEKDNDENNDELGKKISAINGDLAEKILGVKIKLIQDILEKEDNLRIPREQMRNKIILFLGAQLLFLILFILGLFIAKGRFGSFSDSLFVEILSFLKFYIAAIISEFIAMVFFIVKFLFNTKLIDVIEKWVNKL